MHIVHVYKDYFPVLGGIENHIRVLAQAQARSGHDVTVLVCSPNLRSWSELRDGVRIVRCGRLATIASMPISLAQPLALARLRPDIAHIQSPYPVGEATNWLLGRARATVLSYQSDIVRQAGWLRLYAPTLKRVLQAADRIIVSSKRYMASSPWLSSVRAKCRVVPLSVDHCRFHPPAFPYGGPPTLLFVGRLRYYKGVDTLIRALASMPGAHLAIVGTGTMQESWRTMVDELELGERVRFLGDVPDAELPAVYHRAHAFVLPANARSEAFGRVLLEAMASGLPCITTEVGTGTSWVVQDQVTGFVVPPSDTAALGAAIRRLLSAPELRRSMGCAGRARVLRHFTQDRMVTAVQAVYGEALGACDSCGAR